MKSLNIDTVETLRSRHTFRCWKHWVVRMLGPRAPNYINCGPGPDKTWIDRGLQCGASGWLVAVMAVQCDWNICNTTDCSAPPPRTKMMELILARKYWQSAANQNKWHMAACNSPLPVMCRPGLELDPVKISTSWHLGRFRIIGSTRWDFWAVVGKDQKANTFNDQKSLFTHIYYR